MFYHNLDPVAFNIGAVKVHWYGLMYLIGFMIAWILGRSRAGQAISGVNLSSKALEDFIFYGAVGVLLGGRVGYLLFYDLNSILNDPWLIFKVWEGGMSFHGGLLGVIIALGFFASKLKLPFFQLLDFAAPLVPIGLGLGRIGNFINAELFGRVTSVPWAVVFSSVDNFWRHPSQLYEALTEGLLLFIVLWRFSASPRRTGATSAVFLIGYGIIRFTCEFFREPDSHLGFVIGGWLTMGQLLSLLMILAGIWLVVLVSCRKLKY